MRIPTPLVGIVLLAAAAMALLGSGLLGPRADGQAQVAAAAVGESQTLPGRGADPAWPDPESAVVPGAQAPAGGAKPSGQQVPGAPSTRKRIDELNGQAKEALDGGRASEAVLLLESARGLAPDDQVLGRNLAFAHYKVGEITLAAHDIEGATAAFRQAWKLDPDQSAYGLHVASLLLRSFRLDEALSQLDGVLSGHPDNASGQLLRGDVLNLLDRLDDSLECYERSLELGDGSVAAAARAGLERTRRQLAVEQDYVSEETAYFVVRHPPASDHLRLLGVLERARVEVCHALGSFPSHKALVVLYPPEAFREVTATHDWVGGLFDRKIRLPIADVDQGSDEIEASFRHEFTHLMVSEWNPRCPTFINEGLAQVMEFGRGQGLQRLVDHLDARGASRESPPALVDLPESFVTMTDREAVGLGYRLSYAFIDHVIARHGMGAVVRWIRALEQADLADAYHQATGHSLEHEEQLFRELLRTAR